MDTIFAVSSGRPPAAIAIVRISGDRAGAVLHAVSGGIPEPRRAVLRALRDADGGLLDRALILWFPGPATSTGEDLAELHLHGGRAVIAAVERTIAALPGLRAAQAGEFTRRALVAGRIDLSEAEGLADLLAAETESQRIVAIANAEGALSREIAGWTNRLAEVRAAVEAMIDFEDEGDVPQAWSIVTDPLNRLSSDLAVAVARPSVDRVNQGFRVVIAGPPNAGKSSLFNALIERDAAIVAPVAGTTRDRIDAAASRSGLIFTISDTAGLAEDSDDPIERAGIVRSRQAMAQADVVVWLSDEPPVQANALWVRGRCDLAGRQSLLAGQILAVSAYDANSVDRLWEVMEKRAAAGIAAAPYLLHQHQRGMVIAASDHVARALGSTDPLIAAEELRLAARDLAQLTGVDATEAMLDSLFGRFCIGK